MMTTLSKREFLQVSLLAGAGTAAASSWAAPAAAERPTLAVRTLGTGAADHRWDHLGEPGVRGSAGTLIDGRVLIDCGVTGRANLSRFNVAPTSLTDLVITHSHGDHFNIDQIGGLIADRGPSASPLAVWAAPQLIAKLHARLPGGCYTGHALNAGATFDIGALHWTALPANHLIVGDPSEQALHYLIESPGGNLLYALDGAWMLKQERMLLGRKRLDMIIWDATMVKPGDARIFEHNDLDMIAHMMLSLEAAGCVHAKTVCVLDHVARTLWPTDGREAEKIASDRGWRLAADGQELRLG
jgi:phosphoribosyl 1,2-cyclic phosphate phosphodiesterase